MDNIEALQSNGDGDGDRNDDMVMEKDGEGDGDGDSDNTLSPTDLMQSLLQLTEGLWYT